MWAYFNILNVQQRTAIFLENTICKNTLCVLIEKRRGIHVLALVQNADSCTKFMNAIYQIIFYHPHTCMKHQFMILSTIPCPGIKFVLVFR